MTDTDRRNGGGSPWGRPAWLASAGLLGAVVVAWVGVTIGRPAPPAHLPAAPASHSPVVQTGDGACPVQGAAAPDSDVQPPTDVVWTTLNGLLTPGSPTAGPLRTDPAGLRRCFAHDGAGALLAQAVYDAQRETTDHDQLAALISYAIAQETRGPVLARLPQTLPTRPAGYTPPQIVAYRATYAGDTAAVELVRRRADGTLLLSRSALVWQDGDWRTTTNAAGQVQEPAILYSTTGYTPWPG